MAIDNENFSKIDSLKSDIRNLNIIVKILNIGPNRAVSSKTRRSQNLIADALVGDETGTILLTLWNEQITKFSENDVVQIKGGYTSRYRGSLRLNTGKYGKIEKTNTEIAEVNTKNNRSEKTHIQIPWRVSERKPFRRRRRK